MNRPGPDGPRRGPQRGPHRAKRGAAAISALMLLSERPMNGYELIAEMEARSQGRWRPSPGSMYPALARLEERGVIESSEVDGKKQYQLTDKGRERLAGFDLAEPKPWDVAGGSRHNDLRPLMGELMGQLRQIGRFGTDGQRDAAATILKRTKAELYAVLATESPTDPGFGDSAPGDSAETDSAATDSAATDSAATDSAENKAV